MTRRPQGPLPTFDMLPVPRRRAAVRKPSSLAASSRPPDPRPSRKRRADGAAFPGDAVALGLIAWVGELGDFQDPGAVALYKFK